MIGDIDPNPDVAAELMRLADGHGRLLWHHSKRWSSPNFVGTRDQLCLEYIGAEAMAAGTALATRLAKLQFRLPGRSVDDLQFRLPGRSVAEPLLGFNRLLQKPMPRFVAVFELLLVKD